MNFPIIHLNFRKKLVATCLSDRRSILNMLQVFFIAFLKKITSGVRKKQKNDNSKYTRNFYHRKK